MMIRHVFQARGTEIEILLIDRPNRGALQNEQFVRLFYPGQE